MNKFNGLMSLKEASIVFCRAESTLKESIKRGYFQVGVDCKKFGSVWIFDVKALEKRYGKLREKTRKCNIDNNINIEDGEVCE